MRCVDRSCDMRASLADSCSLLLLLTSTLARCSVRAFASFASVSAFFLRACVSADSIV